MKNENILCVYCVICVNIFVLIVKYLYKKYLIKNIFIRLLIFFTYIILCINSTNYGLNDIRNFLPVNHLPNHKKAIG